ncbi:hypothetical protein NDI56_03900 [Haloarcula sp. S1CR25-12]|uniref:J domain-containing protein n=1 Tax=Haloarcula saliterrae TaxID=2950534 RepID=A0ABU2F8H7_9EURY|nr:hypothetical protein [Haloarcula sp. S1CR25-12]MDS0258554.1 hypothetical protein [Haloarcula sp. S1CR25-12]
MPSDQVRQLDWPAGYDRTDPNDREPYPGDLSPTRKESFESVVDELERWGATSVDIETASQHYVDRPNIPHQHDKPDDVGVVVRFRHEDKPAEDELAYACDRWETQRENARAIALYVKRMRLAERCGIATGQSTVATAQLPSGNEEAIAVGDGSGGPSSTQEPHVVLGVAPDAPDDVVEAVARRLSANAHPDNDDGDRDKFQRIQQAKEAMLDEG